MRLRDRFAQVFGKTASRIVLGWAGVAMLALGAGQAALEGDWAGFESGKVQAREAAEIAREETREAVAQAKADAAEAAVLAIETARLQARTEAAETIGRLRDRIAELERSMGE